MLVNEAAFPKPAEDSIRLRPFLITLTCVWIALGIAAYIASQRYDQSHWIMTALLPAFLLESLFYLAAGFEATRDLLRRLGNPKLQGAFLVLSAVLPYYVFSALTGTYQTRAFLLLLGLAAVVSFWYVLLPRRVAFDVGLLVVLAAVRLLDVFDRIYLTPNPKIHVEILGQLMWIHLAIFALLILRDWKGAGFSFWPARSEWRAGFAYFIAGAPVLVLLALGLHYVKYVPPKGEWWEVAGIAIGTFFGIFWVVALGEEFLFRGVIQNALLRWPGSKVLALVVSSILFGLVHLWYRQFPNWKHVLIATVLGLFCGSAYLQTRSIRASMVTHALIVVVWRVWLR